MKELKDLKVGFANGASMKCKKRVQKGEEKKEGKYGEKLIRQNTKLGDVLLKGKRSTENSDQDLHEGRWTHKWKGKNNRNSYF